MPQPPVGPSDDLGTGSNPSSRRKKADEDSFWYSWSHSPSFQAALTTIVGLGMVFGAGVGYLEWYKAHVLHRMERAFDPGYDPALELSTIHSPDSDHIRRQEQPLIDSIVRGEHAGQYYLLVGPKGTGKGTMILDAMRKISADGASVCEAHPDLEVFRLRLGKALDFDYFEDWQGSLFSRADPRQGGPALDVERAMNKLEKVALRYTRKHGRPLVVAFNNIHLFPNTPEGHSLLHQLQQRAESWAEGGIMTMIFSTDDFWCLEMLRKNASRMRVISTYDLSATESLRALRGLRQQSLSILHPGTPVSELQVESEEVMRKCYELVGGRTSYLVRLSKAPDMLEEATRMVETEKAWLQSQIGLIPEHDDDVMDEQKWASCSWLLLRHFARQGPVLHSEVEEDDRAPDDDVERPEVDLREDIVLPKVSYEEARRIMTRTDFIEPLDHLHVIAIDTRHNVRPDSVLLLRAAQQVVAEEDFDDMLDQTRDRVDQIEGLHRQSELTVKEPFRVVFDRKGGKSVLEVVGLGESFVPAEDEEEGLSSLGGASGGGDEGDGRLV
ncbi:hypothetical protein EHS25_002534 [Saitozyma podzolica]|uniref:AAA protein C-terminal winged helix domain-containing protein n=1 Tax=Saitozyma podzolica TaxID=1890683 RepID=A0A427YCS7_9TREE|nr:hypothetical protein EHS25_002534 [Saitozyma podzolica]